MGQQGSPAPLAPGWTGAGGRVSYKELAQNGPPLDSPDGELLLCAPPQDRGFCAPEEIGHNGLAGCGQVRQVLHSFRAAIGRHGRF